MQRTRFFTNPINWLLLTLLVFSIRDFFLLKNGLPLNGTARMDGFAFGYIAACWVARDMTKSRHFYPLDWIVITTVIFFPSYLWMTRRWRGLAILGGLAAFFTLYDLAEIIVFRQWL